MERTTLADARVKKLLDERFVLLDLDIEKHEDAGAWFASPGVPDY